MDPRQTSFVWGPLELSGFPNDGTVIEAGKVVEDSFEDGTGTNGEYHRTMLTDNRWMIRVRLRSQSLDNTVMGSEYNKDRRTGGNLHEANYYDPASGRTWTADKVGIKKAPKHTLITGADQGDAEWILQGVLVEETHAGEA